MARDTFLAIARNLIADCVGELVTQKTSVVITVTRIGALHAVIGVITLDVGWRSESVYTE